jgi:hypothetical protein
VRMPRISAAIDKRPRCHAQRRGIALGDQVFA